MAGTACSSKNRKAMEIVSPQESFYLSPDRLKELENKSEQGDIEALNRVVMYYMLADHNHDNMMKYLRILAEKGDPNGQYNLGYYMLSSDDQEKRNEGIIWIEKSADSGSIHAQKYLAGLYEKGGVVEQNYEKAKQWYEKAAYQGDVRSIIELSGFYLDGKGCEKNRIKAYALLLVAELYINRKTFMFKLVKNKKNTIALSDADSEQATIEFEQLKKMFTGKL